MKHTQHATTTKQTEPANNDQDKKKRADETDSWAPGQPSAWQGLPRHARIARTSAVSENAGEGHGKTRGPGIPGTQSQTSRNTPAPAHSHCAVLTRRTHYFQRQHACTLDACRGRASLGLARAMPPRHIPLPGTNGHGTCNRSRRDASHGSLNGTGTTRIDRQLTHLIHRMHRICMQPTQNPRTQNRRR